MKKTLKAIKAHFESSSGRTPQYLSFHRLFKKEFTAFLTKYGAKDIQISKPNHFDASGFFATADGRIFYFSIGDLRSFKENMLVRTAAHFKDYSGGRNEYASLSSESAFEKDFVSIVKPGRLPARDCIITNELVNQIREQEGI